MDEACLTKDSEGGRDARQGTDFFFCVWGSATAPFPSEARDASKPPAIIERARGLARWSCNFKMVRFNNFVAVSGLMDYRGRHIDSDARR